MKAVCYILAMRKLLLVAALGLGTTQAANIMEVAQSAQPLHGALEQVADLRGSFMAAYVPEYGLTFTGNFTPYSIEPVDPSEVIEAAQGIVAGLAPTVTGLEASDWVSVSATVVQGAPVFVTIRIKPNQPESLEVWVDGVKH